MQSSFSLKPLFRLSLFLMVMLAVQLLPARANDSPSFNIYFGPEVWGTITIGRSFPLSIDIVAGANPIRGISLQCSQEGTALSAQSISRLPNTVLIGAHQTFHTEQYYRAVAAGTTSVSCVFKGTDTVTGLPFTMSSSTTSLDVSGETRLYFDVSGTQFYVATGEDARLMVVYANRGSSLLTNINVSCGPGNRGFLIDLKRQTRTSLPPGQSGFAEFVAPDVLSGALLSCFISATDSSTGELIALQSGAVRFTLKY
jgi:hypothetical protein